MSFKRSKIIKKWMHLFYKHALLLTVSLIVLFITIGAITTAKPSARLSSDMLAKWTSNVDSSLFSLLYAMDNNTYKVTVFEKNEMNLSKKFIGSLTNITFSDTKSFLSREIPGFYAYENNIIIAGEGIDKHSVFSDESGPPIDIILQDRVAVNEDDELDTPNDNEKSEIVDAPNKLVEDVLFLYSSHNRESFLPHLPGETDTNAAYHENMNITKVSERLKESLQKNGIGAIVDDTDFTNVLRDKGWSYSRSYAASRPVVEEAIKTNKKLQYIFDIHRDSLPRKLTTKEINGENYSKLLFVIGAKYDTYEKNLKLATQLHYLIEEKYPGLSKGVITKDGPNANGIYNQDLFENAILIEVGGPENTLEEMYRTADVLAEVFSQFYFDAEQVNK